MSPQRLIAQEFVDLVMKLEPVAMVHTLNKDMNV